MASILPRIHSYPVLAKNSLDYLPEHRYETQHSRTESKDSPFITIDHEISESNLVARFISEGYAAFACTLTSAHSAYREVFVEKTKDLKHIQKLAWDNRKVLFPLLFQPAVVVLREIKDYYLGGADGVHEIWRGSRVSFPRGSILAIAPFWQSQSTAQSILRIRKEEEIPEGCYEVVASVEEGFYFLVTASPQLFESLQNPGRHSLRHRDSIYTAAFAEGLGILSREFKNEEKWRDYHNLRSLHAEMKRKNLKAWYEEDFSPNRAAAIFLPHRIDTEISSDD